MVGNYQGIESLVTEIERIEKSKQDLIVPHPMIRMVEDNVLSIGNGEEYLLTSVSHQQVSEKLGIPKKYYEAMGSIPGLRSTNVNAWLDHTDSERKLVRTLDGNARAFLSDKYLPFDNFTVMESFLPILEKHVGNIQVKSCSLTEKKMYVQIVFPGIQSEVKKGDIVQAGITLSNSEVGCASVDISTLIWRLVCTNGMVGQSLVSRYHVGRRINDDVQEMNIFKHDTVVADIEAFRLKLRDVFEHALTQDVFEGQVDKLRKAADDKVKNPVRTIENVTKRFGFTNQENEGIMTNFVTGGDMSRWGVANSITALAKSIENRDRQFAVEQMGYEIVDLPTVEWEVINE